MAPFGEGGVLEASLRCDLETPYCPNSSQRIGLKFGLYEVPNSPLVLEKQASKNSVSIRVGSPCMLSNENSK